MRLIDVDEIKLPQGFFEKVDNVPKFYEWLGTLPTVDAEPTEEQVKEYCRKRNLVVVDSELFNEMKARWSETVKHGHWKPFTTEQGLTLGVYCSECKQFLLMNPTPYCPNCGAKMDGGERRC